jgi:hypothetical protein
MEKENNKSIVEKLGILTGFIKNVKFLLLTIIALVALGGAIFSGAGKDIALSLYKNVTGQKYRTFSPIKDYSNATYIILKDKLSRDKNIGLENTDITIFQESETLHRYRVKLKDEVYFYSVKKKQNETWQIYKE